MLRFVLGEFFFVDYRGEGCKAKGTDRIDTAIFVMPTEGGWFRVLEHLDLFHVPNCDRSLPIEANANLFNFAHF